MKRLYYYVRRFMWYRDMGYAELTSPLNGLGIILNTFTFLTVRYGIKFPWWFYFLFILFSIVAVGFLGIVAVKHFDSLKITTELGNKENEAMQEILTYIRKDK